MQTQNSTTQPESQSIQKRTPIYAGSKVVGEVIGSTFRKNAQGSRHFLRQPRGIAADDSTLQDAAQAGAVDIAVRDTENGLVYRAPLVAFEKHGIPIRRGFGNQTALPMDRWTVTRAGVVVQAARADETPAAQYSLFDATEPAAFEKPEGVEYG